MNEKEKKKFDTIKKLLNNELTIKETMIELKLSRQQVYRLIKLYKDHGEEGFINKNRGKESNLKISKDMIEELENLYLDEYYDYNFIAFYDELNENKKYKGKYEISYSTLYREFLNDDIISPIAHKGTIKLYNEKISNAINNNEEIQEEKVELFPEFCSR